MKVIAFLFILLFALSSQKLLQSDVVYAVNCASTAYTTKSGIKYEAVIFLFNKNRTSTSREETLKKWRMAQLFY